jgi:hypothetical protein
VAPSCILLAGVEGHGPHRRAVGSVRASYPGSTSKRRRSRKDPGEILATSSTASSGYCAPALPGRTFPRTLSTLPDLPSTLSEAGRRRGPLSDPRSFGRRPRRAWGDRPLGVLHRRHFRGGQKRGERVGKTKRAKGTKRSWRFQTALLLLSPSTHRVLHRTRSPLLRRLWQAAF